MNESNGYHNFFKFSVDEKSKRYKFENDKMMICYGINQPWHSCALKFVKH